MTPKDKISQTLMQLHANVITWLEAEKVIFPAIDSLISTAEKQGEETYRAFVENNDTRRVAMAALSMQSSQAYERGKAEGVSEFEKKRADTFEKLIDDHDTAFASGVAEGEEREKERIRKGSEKVATLNEAYHAVECHFPPDTPLFIVPELMLVLSKEEYPTIDEYVASVSVLAPTKESEKSYYAVGDNGEGGESHA